MQVPYCPEQVPMSTETSEELPSNCRIIKMGGGHLQEGGCLLSIVIGEHVMMKNV